MCLMKPFIRAMKFLESDKTTTSSLLPIITFLRKYLRKIMEAPLTSPALKSCVARV